MKKLVGILLAMTMLFMAGCASFNEGGNEGSDKTADIASADLLLNQVFDTYKEEEKFPAMGGDAANMVDGKAGLCDLADTESLDAMLHIPAELVGDVEEVASYVHAMNANTFTGAAYKLKDGADNEAFVATLDSSIMAIQWMCGFPEKLVIYTVENYVVAAFGNGEIMDTFVAKMTEVYGEQAVLYAEEIIA